MGEREWYVNMSSPLNDTIFSLSSGGTEKGSLNASTSNATKITREPDGSGQIQGLHTSGKYNLQVRMRVGNFGVAERSSLYPRSI